MSRACISPLPPVAKKLSANLKNTEISYLLDLPRGAASEMQDEIEYTLPKPEMKHAHLSWTSVRETKIDRVKILIQVRRVLCKISLHLAEYFEIYEKLFR